MSDLEIFYAVLAGFSIFLVGYVAGRIRAKQVEDHTVKEMNDLFVKAVRQVQSERDARLHLKAMENDPGSG